ncbi:hypothetical protein CBR_g51284 [Chara braunii]|uniref:Uncharacterized protein n=1 Tax=Chara braunii TaxID=69332 RepID=A0A388M857_CHABU|nr:hypothetical protein CBR_g51284 [Chara braunii]|eukprot:GBG90777.1 hypothetical protein CBR_g51284 [Chara braunii]
MDPRQLASSAAATGLANHHGVGTSSSLRVDAAADSAEYVEYVVEDDVVAAGDGKHHEAKDDAVADDDVGNGDKEDHHPSAVSRRQLVRTRYTMRWTLHDESLVYRTATTMNFGSRAPSLEDRYAIAMVVTGTVSPILYFVEKDRDVGVDQWRIVKAVHCGSCVPAQTTYSTVHGWYWNGNGRFYGILLLDSDYVLVPDHQYYMVRKLGLLSLYQSEMFINVKRPWGLAKHPKEGTLYVSAADRIYAIPLDSTSFLSYRKVLAGYTSTTSVFKSMMDSSISSNVRFDVARINPRSITPDGSVLYLQDVGNDRIRMVDTVTGATSTVLTGSSVSGLGSLDADPVTDRAPFRNPRNPVLTANGCNMFLSDGSRRIRWVKFSAPGGDVLEVRTLVEILNPIYIISLALSDDDSYLYASLNITIIARFTISTSALHPCGPINTPPPITPPRTPASPTPTTTAEDSDTLPTPEEPDTTPTVLESDPASVPDTPVTPPTPTTTTPTPTPTSAAPAPPTTPTPTPPATTPAPQPPIPTSPAPAPPTTPTPITPAPVPPTTPTPSPPAPVPDSDPTPAPEQLGNPTDDGGPTTIAGEGSKPTPSVDGDVSGSRPTPTDDGGESRSDSTTSWPAGQGGGASAKYVAANGEGGAANTSGAGAAPGGHPQSKGSRTLILVMGVTIAALGALVLAGIMLFVILRKRSKKTAPGNKGAIEPPAPPAAFTTKRCQLQQPVESSAHIFYPPDPNHRGQIERCA